MLHPAGKIFGEGGEPLIELVECFLIRLANAAAHEHTDRTRFEVANIREVIGIIRTPYRDPVRTNFLIYFTSGDDPLKQFEVVRGLIIHSLSSPQPVEAGKGHHRAETAAS